jgi:hypothetical protein
MRRERRKAVKTRGWGVHRGVSARRRAAWRGTARRAAAGSRSGARKAVARRSKVTPCGRGRGAPVAVGTRAQREALAKQRLRGARGSMRVVRRKLREHGRAGAASLGSALDAKPRHGRRRAAQLRLRPGCVEARRQRAAGAQRAVVQGHAPTAGGILGRAAGAGGAGGRLTGCRRHSRADKAQGGRRALCRAV